jgi:hypothetical protein
LNDYSSPEPEGQTLCRPPCGDTSTNGSLRAASSISTNSAAMPSTDMLQRTASCSSEAANSFGKSKLITSRTCPPRVALPRPASPSLALACPAAPRLATPCRASPCLPCRENVGPPGQASRSTERPRLSESLLRLISPTTRRGCGAEASRLTADVCLPQMPRVTA